MGTVMAWAALMARSAMIHWRLVLAKMPTRSPGWMPWAMRPADSAFTSSSTCA